ncbi:Lar family restriction alleviation protein [Sinorhizobium meliloti]|uniref:Lar family restriction alleviation protein n=1 Tax=Rhizobium meliloti TaxID=382 RepID=UPI00398C8BB3
MTHTNLTAELKPCPFCGDGMDSFAGMTPDAFAKSSEGGFSVCCDCGAMGATGGTMEAAIAVWNDRSSPTNLENAERAEMTMTPHAYAQEYEFRGDTDYTPSDFERTMIEDAILGYLGEARIAERAERGTFSPPFSYVPIPLDEEGQGPADDVDAVSVAHDVWDANCVTVATCGNEEAARSVAALMNAGVEARIRADNDPTVTVPVRAYSIADAMIAARSKPSKAEALNARGRT